jgi:hypothetical protein
VLHPGIETRTAPQSSECFNKKAVPRDSRLDDVGRDWIGRIDVAASLRAISASIFGCSTRASATL